MPPEFEDKDFIDLLRACVEAMQMRAEYNKIAVLPEASIQTQLIKDVRGAVEELLDLSGPNTFLERRVGELGALLKDRLSLLWGEDR